MQENKLLQGFELGTEGHFIFMDQLGFLRNLNICMYS